MRPIVISLITVLLVLGFSSSCKKEENGDNNKPFIVMNPPNPLYWGQDMPYNDPGAEAFDVTETGDTVNISDRLQVQNNVDVTTLGDYNVNYNVSDEAGNNADQKTRDVRVVITK